MSLSVPPKNLFEPVTPSRRPPVGDGILDGAEELGQVSLSAQADAAVSITSNAAVRLSAIAVTFIVLIAGTYIVPGAERFRPWQAGEGYTPFWNIIGRELLGEGRAVSVQSEETEQLVRLAEEQAAVAVVPADEQEEAVPNAPALPLDHPLPTTFPDYQALPGELEPPKVDLEGSANLAPYFKKLTLVQLGFPKVIARAAMWGDSVLGNDGVTHALRRRMQSRFGDAGHGFIAMGRYNPAYFHQGTRFQDRGVWRRCEIIFHCEDDGRYGFAGVTATSSGGGESWFSTTKQGIGSRVSRFEVWYAKERAGGKFQIKVDGTVAAVTPTAGEGGDGVEVVEVEDGYHEFEVRAVGGGPVKSYGAVLERSTGGVVWDSLGLIGSFTQRLDYQDAEHIAGQVAQRQVDLLSFILGGNDVQREKMDLVHSMTRYEDEYTRVIKKFKQGRPQASCLVLSLVDHGERVGPHAIHTRGIVPKLVESQRRVAAREGCAFFDTFTAMGGDGSIGRWYRATPQLAGADFSHPTQAGHEVIASLVHKALMYQYAKYRVAQTGKPLSEEAAPAKASE